MILYSFIIIFCKYDHSSSAAVRLSIVSKSVDKARSAVAIRILPVLSVFCEWGGEQRRYLQLPYNSSTNANSHAVKTFEDKDENSVDSSDDDDEDNINDEEEEEDEDNIGDNFDHPEYIVQPRPNLPTRKNLLARKCHVADEKQALLDLKKALLSLQDLLEASIRVIPSSTATTPPREKGGGSGFGSGSSQSGIGGSNHGSNDKSNHSVSVRMQQQQMQQTLRIDRKILFRDTKGRPLPEHVELRGFLPMADRYEVRDE